MTQSTNSRQTGGRPINPWADECLDLLFVGYLVSSCGPYLCAREVSATDHSQSLKWSCWFGHNSQVAILRTVPPRRPEGLAPLKPLSIKPECPAPARTAVPSPLANSTTRTGRPVSAYAPIAHCSFFFRRSGCLACCLLLQLHTTPLRTGRQTKHLKGACPRSRAQ